MGSLARRTPAAKVLPSKKERIMTDAQSRESIGETLAEVVVLAIVVAVAVAVAQRLILGHYQVAIIATASVAAAATTVINSRRKKKGQ